MLTHFVTTPDSGTWFYTYNGVLAPEQIKGIWDKYQQKDINDELLFLYGWGDGGGGPTREQIEAGRVLKDVPGMPTVEQGTAEPYFERLAHRLAGKHLPVWDGELYLEYHRGTYTSQAYVKRQNRLSEILFHNAEWLSSLACVLAGSGSYPSEALRVGWETILLNQFHDILPGSSIRQVYEDCRVDYARVRQAGETAVTQAQEQVLAGIPLECPGLVVFNSLSWERDGLVELHWGGFVLGEGFVSQVIQSGDHSRILLEVESVPSLGYAAYPLVRESSAASEQSTELVVTPEYLENSYYQIRLNHSGQIASLYDKRNRREVLSPGRCGNVLQAFEDKPMNFDAWDIDIYYQEKQVEVDHLLEAVVEETGPLRGVLRLAWRFGASTVTQWMTIYRSSPRIDFRTHIDWRESQVLLKAAFPVDVRATRATYEVQFGSLERPTHWNTSWDYARFESVAHKWVDLSEGGYGVALLNDCKYGHDVKDNVMRLTLLKSAIEPDPLADKCEHEFTYSLLPHTGDWRQGEVTRHAYDLNYPLLVIPVLDPRDSDAAATLPPRTSFAELNADHVILETVKQAEDGGWWVVRLYEFEQRRAQGLQLRFARPLADAVECNLVEEAGRPARFAGDTLTFDITPFEIKTFKLRFH